ncbi:hypothetical protein PPERSA_12280 [Pseudocohnilembus persalinus]|uniref:Uncharacterized protein n=1 Tax=Pseudocohnilembus persalinus TaxID=266149 RepID=A0A0V0R4Y3_PSEPJ|nr:hypothetical protein PPERSA_12280 [Pseudocohnilembus persalinus]|eukprot:KRX09537.1 hypothetical protein PPERSA_12280 [Pseudocohnilembus persalinus]
MKILPQNVTLSYQTQQLRQCYFFQDKGFLLIPVKIPTKIPQNKKKGDHFNEILQQEDNIVTKNQEDIFNTISHLKFSYKFLENELEEEEEDFENEEFGTKKGFYQIALFQPQILLQNSEKNKAKKLSNYVYQLQIEDLEQDINPKKQKNFIKKQVIFDNSINKYTSELIEKAEFLKEGNALNDNSLVLKLNLVLKRLYSDDVDQDEQEPEIVWEKRDSLNLNLSLNLQISMKQNPFINNPNSKIFIAFSQEMEQLMQSTQILEKSSQIKLTYSTLSREAQKEKMSKQKQIHYCGGSKKNKNNKGINEVEFQGYHNTDYILVEIDNGNNQVETGMIKLNNLVLLPAEKELINSHQNSQQSRNNNINDNLNNNMSQLEMEESQAFQSQNGDEINEMGKKKVYEPELEDYYWTLAISSIQKSQNQSVNEGKSVKTAGAHSVKSQFSIKKQNQQMEPETVKIKKQIQQQKLQNNLLVTQLQKERKDLIKKNKQMNELVKIVKINEQPENLKEKKNNEIKKKQRKKVELSEQGKKARELFQNQCICLEGVVVKFGFCENCLREIKEKYDKQLLEYKSDADKYEDQVQEKKELQFELEKKISQKSQKLEFLAEQIEKEENNIQLIMNRLEKQQQKLAKLKDENQ